MQKTYETLSEVIPIIIFIINTFYLSFTLKLGNKYGSILTEKSSIWEAYLKWHEYNLEARDK